MKIALGRKRQQQPESLGFEADEVAAVEELLDNSIYKLYINYIYIKSRVE
jgi:hypothetical protein